MAGEIYYTLEAIGKAAIAGGLDAKLVGSSLAFHAKHSGGLHGLPPEGHWRDQIARDVLLASIQGMHECNRAQSLVARSTAMGVAIIDLLAGDSYAMADAMMKARIK